MTSDDNDLWAIAALKSRRKQPWWKVALAVTVIGGLGFAISFFGMGALKDICHLSVARPACVPAGGILPTVKALASVAAALTAIWLAHRSGDRGDELHRLVNAMAWQWAAWATLGVIALAGVLQVALPGFDPPLLPLVLVVFVGYMAGTIFASRRFGLCSWF
jgi:hypothetical protein